MALPISVPDQARISRGVADFIHTGRAMLPLPVFHLVPQAVAAMRCLICDPSRESWRLCVPRRGVEPDDADDGLIRRSKTYEGEATDDKWFFHWRPSLRSHLAARGVDISAYEDFFEICGLIFSTCVNLSLAFASDFDLRCPGYDLSKRIGTAVAEDLHVLRILAYDVGTTIARPHTDRSLLTFHIAESRPGLRLGEERELYVASHADVLLFPGRKLQNLTRGRFPALVHDVIDVTSERQCRWSIVFFTHVLDVAV